jgi:hypothetical protein
MPITLLANPAGGVSAFRGRCPVDALPDVDALLSASEAAAYAGVSVAAICNWRSRGHLHVAKDGQGQEIRDRCGRPRYRLLDVAKAEHATSSRARRAA